jgi:hypothetical protein
MLAGPTQSGKTSLIKTILKQNKQLISPTITKIYYCYSKWQYKYDLIKQEDDNIEFIEGLPDSDIFDSKSNNLLILDDLMSSCEKDDSILNLFTTNSHQVNISVFLITQNLFSQGKYSRTISLNSHYMIIMNNPRDKLQIEVLARQMFPNKSKFLVEAYEDATNLEYGYLFIDLHQKTCSKFRVQSGITLNEQRIIYTPK